MKMYTPLFVALLTVGCNKLPLGNHNSQATQPVGISDDFYISGVYSADNQTVGVHTSDRSFAVEIKTSEMMEYKLLNKYEYRVLADTTVDGGIKVGKEVVITDEGALHLTGKLYAKSGALYRIHSVANSTGHGI